MAKLRDILIVIVLGSIVLWAVVHFAEATHEASVQMSPVVAEARFACIDDGNSCSFASVEAAQAYLDSPEHRAKAKAREATKQPDSR